MGFGSLKSEEEKQGKTKQSKTKNKELGEEKNLLLLVKCYQPHRWFLSLSWFLVIGKESGMREIKSRRSRQRDLGIKACLVALELCHCSSPLVSN